MMPSERVSARAGLADAFTPFRSVFEQAGVRYAIGGPWASTSLWRDALHERRSMFSLARHKYTFPSPFLWHDSVTDNEGNR